MYFTYHNLDSVMNELKRRRAIAHELLYIWENVKVNKKKNGEEFLQLGRAIEGATVGGYYPVEDELHPYLSVKGYTSFGDYAKDELPIYWYLDELPKEDERRAEYVRQFVRQTTPMTFDEIRKAIKDRVNLYRERVNNYDEQIMNAPQAYKAYRNAIKKANEELEKATQKDGKPSSLYYIVSECH